MPSWEEYWGKGGINDQKIASGAGDAVKSSKPATTSTPYSSGMGYNYGGSSSSYTSTAPTNTTKPSTPTYNTPAPATSYTGASNIIGNVAGSNDLFKSYQDIYNSTRTPSTANSQLNTWGDSKGNVYDTTQMTPQQIFALSLFKDANPKASAILKGMGLDMNGNPTSPTSNYSVNPADLAAMNAGKTSAPASGGGGSLTSSATYKPTMQSGTLTPLASSTQYNVNDKAFQDMPADERKKILLANPTLLQQELDRASKVWFANEGNPQAQAQAHAWAEELRQDAAKQPQQQTQTPTGDQQPPGPLDGVADVINKNQPLTDELMKQWQDLMKGIGGGNTANNAALQQQAQQQAQAIFDQKKTQYQQLIDSLKSGQATDLKNIAGDTTLAESELEDKTFQKWLESRQNVANRGLAGSGASSEADTRLLLSRQKDLGGLYNTQSKAANNINKSYTDKLAAAQASLAGNNLGQTQADIFSKLFKDSQGTMNDQLKAVTDLLSKQFGYSQVNPADYLKASTNIYSTDAKTKVAYDKMDQSDRQFYDKLAQENQKLGIQAMQWQADYGLKSAQIFGQDANGNPTLDAQKFVADMSIKQQQADEQGRHNRASEGIGWAGVQNSRDSIAAKLQSINLQAAKFDKANEQFGLKFQGDTFKDIISTESRNLIDLRGSLDKDPKNESIKKQYDSAVNRLNSAMAGLDNLAKTGLGSNYTGGNNTASTGTSETAGLNLSDDYMKNIRITPNSSGSSSVTDNVFGNN